MRPKAKTLLFLCTINAHDWVQIPTNSDETLFFKKFLLFCVMTIDAHGC